MQKKKICLALAALGLGASSYAQVQSQPNDAGKLEPIIVTANKRDQNLQDVPAAISVLSDATMQRANVRELDDLTAISPALTITYGTQPGNFSLNMRGIGTYSLGIGVEADVSVIIDDVPIGMQAGAFKDLADVFRIEILKGPQSTLFGKSAIAGALNITTKPISGPLKTYASTYLTNDHEWRVGGSISGALTDTLRMRLAVSKTSFDGAIKNLTTGENINGSVAESVVGKIEWAPTDDLDVTISPRFNHTQKYCCSTAFTSMTPGGLYRNIAALPATTVLAGITVGPDNVSTRNDYPTGGVFHDAGVGAKVNYAFDNRGPLAGHKLTSITSYSKYHMDDYQDNDNTDTNLLPYLLGVDLKPSGLTGGLYQWGWFDVKSTTQEFRLLSPETGAFKYVLGLWYGKNDLARSLFKAPLIQNNGTAYGAESWNVNKAVFGQSSWEFTPSWNLITGLRLNREDTGYNFNRFSVPNNPGIPYTTTERFTKSDTNDSSTGRLALEHHVDRDTMFYGMISTGHKGVAYDLTSSFNAALAAKPAVPAETAKNYELGVKLGVLENRGMINIALFRTDFSHFQQSASVFDPDGVFRTSLNSIGGLQTKGLEIDSSFRVTPQLLVNANFAYTKATILDFENGPCYNVLNATGSGTVNGGDCTISPKYNNTAVQDLAGKTLPNAPKYKVNISGQYDMPLIEQSFNAFVSGSTRFQSETQFSLNQNPMTIQGGYSITNVAFGIKDKADRYKLSVLINNLFNKRYANGLNSSLANSNWNSRAPNPVVTVNTTEWNPPRDYRQYFGMRLDMNF